MRLERHFWHRQPAIDAALVKSFAEFVGTDRRVVDIGAGYSPWPHATECVDLDQWPQLADKTVQCLDVELEPLPYADKEVDFAYCRHTIEDLNNPTLLLREMNRTAKAGYVETPSAIAELSRGVDAGAGLHRGYSHHRWFCWVDRGELILLPKLAVMDIIPLTQEDERRLIDLLTNHLACWNNYFPWRGELKFRVLRQRIDFNMQRDYFQLVARAVELAQQNAAQFVRDFGLEGATFIGTAAEPQQDQG